jgi:catechol 2,3-dioxygenase-like lactoylglutathione lyase family enzyme
MGIARLRDVPWIAPSMPTIEHLRKQAKLYLRWHRDRYYPVAARIRAVLPRYSRLTDREILAQPFRLSDAQELVARTVGFDSWEALRWGSHSSPARTGTLAMTTVVAAEPQLYVRDIVASSAFYSTMLGFSVAFTYGEPPFYGQVFRGGARLNLRHVDAPVVDPVQRDTQQLLAASITVDDAKPLFLEFQKAGVEFAQPLRTEPWGARTFVVRDPDGNLLLFAGPGGMQP